MDVLTTIFGWFSKFIIIAGGAYAVWGAIGLAGALKDHNGPALQAGIWGIVGGAIIIVAGTYFTTLV